MEDEPTDRSPQTDGAEQGLQEFSAEFQRVVDDLPAQRAIKDIDELMKVVDELAGRTIHLGSLSIDSDEVD